MATLRWIGAAGNRPQVTTITVANAWAAADTVTVTIGGQAIVLTLGTTSATSVTTVATAITNMINATSRTDDLESGDSRTAGGQQIPQWREVEASSAAGVVTITTKEKYTGVPFTIASTEVTAGTGTAVAATSQLPTSKWHFDNALNWDSGTVPVDDDVVIFRDSNVSVKYGAAEIEARVEVWQSFTGNIGLPVINIDDPQFPYYEYRSRYKLFDDGGLGTALTHKFGIGDGPGSPLINIAFDSTSLLVHSVVVYNTGVPTVQGGKALVMCVNNNSTATGTVTVLNGHVETGYKWFSSPAFGTLNVPGPANVSVGSHTAALSIVQTGGRLLIPDGTVMTNNLTISINGGEMTCGVSSAATVSCTVANGRLTWNSAETIDSYIGRTKGILDLEKDSRAVTISTCDLFEGAQVLDDNARGTYTAGIDANGCGNDDVVIRVGNNRRFTIGAAA